MSQQEEPLTEELLGAVDALITDWSSIATDFLPLARPIVFLDRPAPAEDLSPLSEQDRPGAIVSNIDQLGRALLEAVSAPETYIKRYGVQRDFTLERAWGVTLDGRSSERYLSAIESLLEKKR
jgi:CDP-glycerol glycerophosphotransferase (TagB/SpsB family)